MTIEAKHNLSENNTQRPETKNDSAVLYIEQFDFDKEKSLVLEADNVHYLMLGDTPHTRLSCGIIRSNPTKPGTSQKKPPSGEQNYRKQKLRQSDIAPHKWPNFYSQNRYNPATTRNLLIYLFLKILSFISCYIQIT